MVYVASDLMTAKLIRERQIVFVGHLLLSVVTVCFQCQGLAWHLWSTELNGEVSLLCIHLVRTAREVTV